MARPTEDYIKKSIEKGNQVKINQELQSCEIIINQFNEVFEYFGDLIRKK